MHLRWQEPKGRLGYAIKVMPPPALSGFLHRLFVHCSVLRMRRVIQQPYRLG